MENQSISRAHYYERQFLRTPDFSDEQAYHLAMQRRHQVSEHIWGIVRGLELILTPDGVPMLLPGIAVDGFGRTLVWQVQRALPLSEFDANGSNTLHVWLVYDELKTNSGPDGNNGCATNDNPDAYNRIQEQPTLRLAVPDTTHPDPRVPPGVDPDNPEFDPTQNPPQSPDAQWPVFLGQVARKREKPTKPWTYTVSMDHRPYAGLVGEMVMHPTGNAWVEIGTPAGDDGKDSRFAVYLNTPKPDDPTQTLPIPTDLDPDPRLEITASGQITLRGDATLNGNLVLEAGALKLEAQDSTPNPAEPWPWMLYRAQGAEETGGGSTSKAAQEAAKKAETAAKAAAQAAARAERLAEAAQKAGGTVETVPTNELRLEMAGHGGGTNRVVIGAWAKGPDGKEAFQPCLTIDDNCNVTVEKNLIVKGFINQLEGSGPYAVTPEVRSMNLGAYAATATSVAGQVQKLYAGAGGITLDMLKQLLDTTDGRLTVLDAVFADQIVRDSFFRELLNHPQNQGEGQKAMLVILLADPGRPDAVVTAIIGQGNARDLMVTRLLSTPDGQTTLSTQLNANPGEWDTLLSGVLADNTALKATVTKILGKPNGIPTGPVVMGDWLADITNSDSLKAVISEMSTQPNGPDQLWKAMTDQNSVVDNFISKLVSAGNETSLNSITGALARATGGADAFWKAVAAVSAQAAFNSSLLNSTSLPDLITALLNSSTAAPALMSALLASDPAVTTLAHALASDPAPFAELTRLGNKIKAELGTTYTTPQWTAFKSALGLP